MEGNASRDDEITLNISSTPFYKTKKKKADESNVGNNAKRHGAAQINYSPFKLEEALSTHEAPTDKYPRKKQKNLLKVEENEKTSEANSSAKKIHSTHDNTKLQISYLFSSNPELPHLTVPNIKVKKESLFSTRSFSDLGLHPHLVSCLQSRFSIEELTEVQEKTIPVLLDHKDALVKSCTGSGKTLAYAVPIMQRLQERVPKIQRSEGVFALVVLPTRELVLQSFECFEKLSKAFTWIVPGYLIGGEKKKSEKARIRKGINVLISTPGRLLDHLEHTTNLSLHYISWFVIDEADKLLEQGFEEAVLKILSSCQANQQSPQRQTVLLSATLTKDVEKLAGMSLVNPTYIDIATSQSEDVKDFDKMKDLVIPSQLKQYIVMAPTKLRLVTLSAFIVEKCTQGNFKALIFMNTQNVVDFHFLLFNTILKPMLKQQGNKIKFFKLHGNMKQEDRTETFNRFKNVEDGVLICTDVAARGLDLPDVDWIIQYNSPTGPENYVHRVGRTARIGKQGSSILFLIPSEIGLIHLLQKQGICMREMEMKTVLPSLAVLADILNENRSKKHAFTVEDLATALQLKYEQVVYTESKVHEVAKEAFLSFVQAYSSYPKHLRPVLPFKMLHLGHVAKSFCLRESPSQLGCHFANKHSGSRDARYHNRALKKRKMNEFDSGLNKHSSRSVSPKKPRIDVSEYDSGLSLLTQDVFNYKKKK